jgi:hypothetical protein
MTATGTTDTARTSRDGHPCPSWCTADHQRSDGHTAPSVRVAVPGAVPGLDDKFLVYPWQSPGCAPEIVAVVLRYGRQHKDDLAVYYAARDAGHLAGLVEMLAAATPGQHRELAAAIREAAAVTAEDAAQ